MSIKIAADAPGGFLVKLFNGGDEIAAKDYVRDRLGLPPWQPNGKGSGHLSPGKEIAIAMAELRKSQGAKIVATYDYTDANGGALLYQVVRYEPKDFRQRRPDGNGGWIWKLGDKRIIYRWPEIAIVVVGNPFSRTCRL